jgi:N-acetylglutamate synthase-like GNAT family acetyltransferase
MQNRIIKGNTMQFQWLKTVENPLVRPFYKKYLPYSRPNKADVIAVLRSDGSIVACARLRPIGKFMLLTGMLVAPHHRGQQVGHALLQQMQPQFHTGKTYTFALTSLAAFYQQHHFHITDAAPNDIQQRYHAYRQQGKDLVLLAFNNSAKQVVD